MRAHCRFRTCHRISPRANPRVPVASSNLSRTPAACAAAAAVVAVAAGMAAVGGAGAPVEQAAAAVAGLVQPAAPRAAPCVAGERRDRCRRRCALQKNQQPWVLSLRQLQGDCGLSEARSRARRCSSALRWPSLQLQLCGHPRSRCTFAIVGAAAAAADRVPLADYCAHRRGIAGVHLIFQNEAFVLIEVLVTLLGWFELGILLMCVGAVPGRGSLPLPHRS